MSLQQETGSIAGSRIFNPLAIAAGSRIVRNAKVGDANLDIPLSERDHVLVEKQDRFYLTISWAYGLATATARVPRSFVQLPDNFMSQD